MILPCILSDYNLPELSGICFQVLVFLCHLKKYHGGSLSMEIKARKLEDTVPSVTCVIQIAHNKAKH